jgi:two-component system, OmpR family, aerobic respiration control sensor histidine kinase ArcB
MDVGLPDISGLEATKEIRKFSHTPIVALTGHVDKQEICLHAGMRELLPKPASPKMLEEMLHKYVISKTKEEDIQSDEMIIDWGSSVKMLDNSEVIAAEILKMCSEGLIGSMEIIDKAYHNQDIEKIDRELHKVRGGVCYLKLPELEEALKNLHITVKENPEEMENCYQRLKKAIQNFQEAFAKRSLS